MRVRWGSTRRLWLAGALGLATTACATSRSIPTSAWRSPRQATASEVLAAFDGYCNGLESLSASGELTVSDLRAGKARSAGVRIAARRGGRLYLKGSVAMVTALEVVSDGERFWFRLPSKKKIWTGPADSRPPIDDGEEEQEAPYRALRPRDVTQALLPEPLALGPGEVIVFEADPRAFSLALVSLEQGRGRARRRVWLDRETLRLARVRTYDEAGELESEVRFDAWQEGSPWRVTIGRPQEGYRASLILSKVQPNARVPDRAFVPRLPDGHALIEIEG